MRSAPRGRFDAAFDGPAALATSRPTERGVVPKPTRPTIATTKSARATGHLLARPSPARSGRDAIGPRTRPAVGTVYSKGGGGSRRREDVRMEDVSRQEDVRVEYGRRIDAARAALVEAE